MSIIRNKILSLETIIENADIILEVEALEGFEEMVKIELEDPSTSIPDFIKRGLIFRVKHILKNTNNTSIPDTIKVPTHNWRRSLSQHKAQYISGPNKSFTVDIYETEVESMASADILFLREYQCKYDLVVKNGFESLKMKEKVVARIGKQTL